MLNEGNSWKEYNVDDSGFPRTPDRLLESFETRARRSEVFETMMGACGPLNSGGSATREPSWHKLQTTKLMISVGVWIRDPDTNK